MQNVLRNIIFLFFANFFVAPFLIALLERLGFYKKKDKPVNKKVHRNTRYYKFLIKNLETPSSFGVLLIINFTLLVLYLSASKEINILIFVSIALGLLGLADDIYEFFCYKKTGHWGFKARYKLIIQLVLLFTLFFSLSGSLLYSILFAFFSTFILNSFNITDGLDGLAGGLAIPTFVFFAYLEYTNFGLTDVFLLILVILSFLLVFLLFNFKPAKTFLGDSGSYLIGAVLGFLTFRYNLYFTLPVIGIFLAEGLSSLIQIMAKKLLNKRVFKIAPLHLHLLNKEWSQWKVIASFWIIHLVVVIVTYIFFQYAG